MKLLNLILLVIGDVSVCMAIMCVAVDIWYQYLAFLAYHRGDERPNWHDEWGYGSLILMALWMACMVGRIGL